MPFDGIGYEGRIDALDKIDQVISLLASEDRWCKQMLCSRDGRRRCIVGAVQDVGGADVLESPILLAIQQVTGRRFRKIERFNDSTSTTFALVEQVLRRARDNIVNDVALVAANGAQGAGVWWRVRPKRLGELLHHAFG